MLNIQPIAAFSDNYIWLLSDSASKEAFVVDPGDAAPVIAALEREGLDLSGVLITHHHFDHVGGLAALRERGALTVYGPHNETIEGIDVCLAAGESIEVLGLSLEVLEVPGHTLDHIAFFHAGSDATEGQPLVFCGDTLFAGGCGRVFEGNPPMMLSSLQRLAALPAATRVYCAHEYTLGNLQFAQAVEPANEPLATRVANDSATRERDEPTVPSTLALELATNPFLRCAEPALIDSLRELGKLEGETPAEVFATVRGWKDNF